MKIMIAFSFLAALAISSKATSAENPVKKVNGEAFVRVVELTDALGHQVLIVGTIHFAPQSYYDRAAHLMTKFAGNSPTKILKEFSTCETEVYDQTTPNISVEDLIDVANFTGAIEPKDFVRRTETSLQPLINKLRLKKSACVLDVDHKTKRPLYLVERNRDWCETSPSLFKSCQWLGLQYPSGPNIKEVEADTVMDQAGAALQIVGVHMYRSWSEMSKVSNSDYSKIGATTGYVILQHRNLKLAEHVLRAFSDDTKKVIVPWGAAHTAGLVPM